MNPMYQPLGYKSHPCTSLVPSITPIPHTPYTHMEQSDWSANPPHYLMPQKPAQALAHACLGEWKCIAPHCLSLCISSSVPKCPSQKPTVRNNQYPSSWTTSPRALGYFSSLSPKEILLWAVGLPRITPFLPDVHSYMHICLSICRAVSTRDMWFDGQMTPITDGSPCSISKQQTKQTWAFSQEINREINAPPKFDEICSLTSETNLFWKWSLGGLSSSADSFPFHIPMIVALSTLWGTGKHVPFSP